MSRPKLRYGADEYGRYAEHPDGERRAVEFYPFWRRYPWRLTAIVSQAYFVLRWHLATYQAAHERTVAQPAHLAGVGHRVRRLSRFGAKSGTTGTENHTNGRE